MMENHIRPQDSHAPSPAPAAVLTKAVRNTVALLSIRQALLAKILGVSPATASRLCAGMYQLDPARSKEWEFAVLLVRLFRSLLSIVGSEQQARKWLEADNLALTGKPIELIASSEGLVRVLHYLDAHRGRV